MDSCNLVNFYLFYGTTGNQELCSIPKQMEGEKREEKTLSNVDDGNCSISMVDRDKLLFVVFSLLQKLGADERPEV